MFYFTKVHSYWILGLCFTLVHGELIHVTGVKCLTVDKTFVKITKCFTKPISKTLSETTINVTLLQEVKTAAVRIQFRKASNGNYNPYFHSDVSLNGCKFFKSRGISPIARYIFSFIEEFTNLNHSCPYKDYVLVDRFYVDINKFKWLPTPSGDFSINSHWILNGEKRMVYELYFSLID